MFLAVLPATRGTPCHPAGGEGALVEAARWEAGRDDDDEDDDDDAAADDAAVADSNVFVVDRLWSLAARALRGCCG